MLTVKHEVLTHQNLGIIHLQIIFLAVRNVPLLFRFGIRPGWFGILINHYPLVHMACSATAADKKSGQSLSHVHLEARCVFVQGRDPANHVPYVESQQLCGKDKVNEISSRFIKPPKW